MQILSGESPSNVDTIGFHRACEAFPKYGDDSYRARLDEYRGNPSLADDTAVVWVKDDDGIDKVIDGRHHLLLCRELGYEVKFSKFVGTREELSSFVKSRNADRRHLTPSQIAASLVLLNEWRHGGDRKASEAKSAQAPLTQQQVANDAGVSVDTVKRAARVLKKAPEVLPAVRDGKLDAKTAAKVADLPKKKRDKIVAAADPKKEAKKQLNKMTPKNSETETTETATHQTAGPTVAKVKVKPPPEVDALGIPIQPHAIEAFRAKPKFQEAATLLKRVRSIVSDLCETPGGYFLMRRCQFERSNNAAGGRWSLADLDNTISLLDEFSPHLTDCPYQFNPHLPHGDGERKCPICEGKRFTGSIKYRQIPEEMIEAMRSHYGAGEEVAN